MRVARLAIVCIVSVLWLTACDKPHATLSVTVNCPSTSLAVVLTNVTNTRQGGNYAVKATFTVTCAGTAVVALYDATMDVTEFTPDANKTPVTLDRTTGMASVHRTFTLNPATSMVTVVVKASDGTEVSSNTIVVPPES
jgi:hypothetical protein